MSKQLMNSHSFTPLHPENPVFQSRDERHIKIKSSRMPRLLRRGVTGFTLIEIVMAMAIFVVGIIGVVYFFPIGLKASKKAGIVSEVAFLAQRKMEETKLKAFDELDGMNGEEGIEKNLTWQVYIDEIDLEYLEEQNHVRRVIVKISWVDEDRQFSKDFVTYITYDNL